MALETPNFKFAKGRSIKKTILRKFNDDPKIEINTNLKPEINLDELPFEKRLYIES